MEYVLETEGLTKIYGRTAVVDHVSMQVRKGDIYGFIGKNGAGKTTFMRMAAGLARPSAGSLRLFGSEDLLRQRMRIGTLIESPGAYPGMTAKENLTVLKKSLGIPDRGRIEELLTLTGLKEAGGKKVKHYSMGMKQRLGIAMALLRDPDFLILDEPINGLDPSGIREVRDLIQELNREKGITILISSHILGELAKVATRYGIIREGALVEESDARTMAERSRRCQKLVTDNVERAVTVLEEALHIQSFDVPEPGVIRVFERLSETAEINRVLTEHGVAIKESYLAGQDLEGYFMELMEQGLLRKGE